MSWSTMPLPGIKQTGAQQVSDNLCPACYQRIGQNLVQMVCGHCGHHSPWAIEARLCDLLDQGFAYCFQDVRASNPLSFKDHRCYEERIEQASGRTPHQEALVVADGAIGGYGVVVAGFDFRYIGGSMSRAVGQRYTRAVDLAIESGKAFITISSSGGARMQEGMFSLIQMARTSSKCQELAEKRLPHISLCTHPTSGGVAASIAMLGDVIIAEPNAFIGFAGPRVIQQTIAQQMPEGFQSAEYCLEQGAIDAIVPRSGQRQYMQDVLSVLMAEKE